MTPDRFASPEIVSVEVPASKSVSHRLQICAALACGESRLHDVLDCDDTLRTREVLQVVGARFLSDDRGGWVVNGISKAGGAGSADVFVGESGSTCRFLAAVLAACDGGEFRVHGAGRMHERPMAPLLDALRSQGCEILCEGRDGCAPFLMRPHGLRGGVVEIETTHTNQYLSGLLMAAPLAKTPMEIVPVGERIASWPYVPLTVQAMAEFGAAVEIRTDGSLSAQSVPKRAPLPGTVRFCVANTGYRAGESRTEGDWSAASYFLAAGALGNKAVEVCNVRESSRQGDRAIVDILRKMGAGLIESDRSPLQSSVIAQAPRDGGRLCGVTVDMGECPDIVPTVVVCALFADSETRITGVEHLRIKECDRGAVLAQELAKIGAEIRVDGGTITVQPLRRDPYGLIAEFCTHGDHRMAMSFSLLELRGIRVQLDNSSCVAKSFPGFFEQWKKVTG